MPSYVPPKKNTEYIFYHSLVSQANTKVFQANPTLATGDVKVAVDDAIPGDLTTVAVDGDFTKRLKVTLSAAQMNGDNITIIFSDQTGDEWCDSTVNIQTSADQLDDVAGNVWDVATSGHTTSGTFGEQCKTDIDAILADTDEIGVNGVGLSNIPWNNTWDTEVVKPLDAGTADGGSSSTIKLPIAASFADDDLISNRIEVLSGPAAGQSRIISDYDSGTDTATVTPNWIGTGPTGASTYQIVGGSSHSSAMEDDLITAAKVAANTIGASELATDAVDEIVDAVWDETSAGHTGGGKAGDQLWTDIDAILDDTNSLDGTKIPDTLSLANIKTQADTALTDIGLQYVLNTALPTSWAANITANSALDYMADDGTAVFDRTTDSLQAIRDNQAGADAAAIADAVWDEAQADHVAAGSFGLIASEIADILTDTGTTLDNHLTDIKGTGFVKDTHSLVNIEGYVDLIDDGTSGLAKIATDVAAILQDTDSLDTTKIPDVLSLANINIQADTALSDIKLHLLMANALPTSWSVDIVANSAIDYLADDGTALYDRTTDSLQAIADASTPPTAAAIADAVWDEASAGHTDAGKAGAQLWTVMDAIVVHLTDIKGTGFVKDTHSLVDIEAYVDLIDDGTSGLVKIATDVAAILADTDSLDTTKIPDILSLANINIQADTALSDIKLQYLISAALPTNWATDVAANSALDYMADDGTAVYDRTSDSLQAIRDRGDAAWLTGGGAGVTEVLNVIPLLPESIDLADTATWRLGFSLTNAVDDLPSTAEISPGTISIDRKAVGGTSWTSVVADAACSEDAGNIYYDEVFDSGTGYTEGDSIRVTFKSQKITVSANDFEVTGASGIIYYTEIRQTMRGTDGANTTTPPTSAAIADAVWDETSAGHTDPGKAGEQLWTDVDAILADTSSLDDTKIPDVLSLANINIEADTALSDIRLQYLLHVALPTDWPTDVEAGAALDHMVDDGSSTFDRTTDSMQVIADRIGAAGAGLTAIPWNSNWDIEVESEVDDALKALGLDHLVSASVVGADIADNSIIAYLASKGATADWDTFVNTTDSLEAIADASTPPSAATIADAVWDEAQADHVAAGSFGLIASEVADILVDTAEIGTAGAGLSNIPWNANWDIEVESECNDALVALGLDHLVAVSVAGPDVADDSIIAKIAAKSSPANFDTFTNVTDSLEGIRDNQMGIDVAAVADAVWDELRADHTLPGSFGEGVLVAAGGITNNSFAANAIDDNSIANSAKEEIADQVWDEVLSGHTTGDTSGRVLNMLTQDAVTLSNDIHLQSVFGQLLDNGGLWSYDRTQHSLEAIRIRGDASWKEIVHILNVIPLIPNEVDLSTIPLTIGLSLINAADDLPTTGEITPGTISIDRRVPGGGSWSAILTDVAMSESNGLITYTEEFDTGTGYVRGDFLRITMKNQSVVAGGNTYEISNSTGLVFYMRVADTPTTIGSGVWDSLRSAHTVSGSFGEGILVATGGITSASYAAGAIDATAIAAGAITVTQAPNLDALMSSRATPAQVNTEVVDALNVDAYGEPGQGAPGVSTSIVDKLGHLYKGWRNRHTQNTSQYALYADDATTIDHKATTTDDGATFDRGEMQTGP